MPPETHFDVGRFNALLRTRVLGRELDYRVQTGSTMDDARAAALQGAPHGTLIMAEEQTAGRGRRGRSFESPPGENLYFTLVLRLQLDGLRKAPIAVPLAVCTACRAAGTGDAVVKWPNDIWAGDLKVCGMLLDSELDGDQAIVLAGIGINVNGDPASIPGLAGIATSLRLVAGRTIDREGLLAAICNDLEAALAAPPAALGRDYRRVSMILGRPVTVLEHADSYQAIAVDLAADGSLVVELPGGERRTVAAGEVSIRPAGPGP